MPREAGYLARRLPLARNTTQRSRRAAARQRSQRIRTGEQQSYQCAGISDQFNALHLKTDN